MIIRASTVPTMLLAIAILFFFNGCGGGGASGATTTTQQPTTADFFHLAVVPYQTVTSTTFEVQVIAENINPNTLPSAPVVIDANGAQHTMALKTLQWPDGSGSSVQVYSVVVPLAVNQLNNIKVISGTKVLNFPITHKPSLTTQTALNATDLQNKIKAAITNPSIDVIQIGYNEADLGLVIHNVGSGITNSRTTWLTLEPMPGMSVTWNRDYPGTPNTIRRPGVNFLNLSGITFGSVSSDGGGYQLYTENGYHLWLSGVQFLGKYVYSVPSTTWMTPVDYIDDVRGSITNGQKVYYTDCLWNGTASRATYGAELARDLRFISHRHDFNIFGKVFLNVVAQDIDTITLSSGSDVLHNDGFQIWQNVGTSDLVFKGFKVTRQNVATNMQPFLFDGTPTPTSYSGILVDSLSVTGASTSIVLLGQFAGNLSNSRISNVSLDQQSIAFRQDSSTGAGDTFVPTNVHMQNFNVKGYLYCAPSQAFCTGGTAYKIANGYPPDVTSQLQAISGMSSVTFSNMLLH